MCAVHPGHRAAPARQRPGGAKRAAAGAGEYARQLGVSSLHITFPASTEKTLAAEQGYLVRTDQQFHWFNDGYESFDDFLAQLASRKRKELRKERARAQEGLTITRVSGDDLTEDHWDAFYTFYMDTGARKWGAPYLNRECFALLHERMAEDIVLVLAEADGRAIAGALNFVGGDALYGRYWGRLEERPFLHFEICYHQAIDEAIARGLARVEAGAQGGHKLARGYAPSEVCSLHWLAEPGFQDAVARYLEQERNAVAQEMEWLGERTPFKKGVGGVMRLRLTRALC